MNRLQKLIAAIIAALTGRSSDRVVRESRKAELKVGSAVQTIKTLQAAVQAATEEAQRIANAQAARLEAALSEHEAAEREREDARKRELDAVIEQGNAAIRALEAALAQAKTDAESEKSDVEQRHQEERDEASRNRGAAADALARLRTTGTKLGEAKAAEDALNKSLGL